MSKKWKWISGLIGAALIICLSACTQTDKENPSGADDSAVEAEETEPSPYSQVLDLTQEQRVEDYDYFVQVLKESYPCWGLLDREGVDYEAIFEEYREMVSENQDDSMFFSAVYSTLFRLGMNGHLSMIEPSQLPGYQQSYSHLENRSHWYDVLTNPVTAGKYPKLGQMLDEQNGGASGEITNDGTDSPENITALIIETGNIAYLKINSFASDMNTDAPKIQAFLEQVKDYNHLILDITQNSGGSDNYWMQLIAAPLAKETLSSTNYALVRNSENNAPYLAEAFGEDELLPIDELSDLPRLADEDKRLATHFLKNTLTVEPTGTGFSGQLWLLVNDRVYSSAEAFTVFCKNTGFATIVGTPTGGDGIGIDPVYLVLPNSGLIVRYSALFGLNTDGSSNEEYGTTPNIISENEEAPLVTALRAIRADENEKNSQKYE